MKKSSTTWIGTWIGIAASLATAPSLSAGDRSAPAAKKVAGTIRLDVQDVRVVDVTRGGVAFDVSWSYVEQDARPNSIMVIAVSHEAAGKDIEAKIVVPVPATGALPTSSRVVVNLGSDIVSPRALNLSVTVTPQAKDAIAIAGKKAVNLTVSPRR